MTCTRIDICVVILLAVVTITVTASAAEPQWREAASRDAIIRDWMHQDYMSARLPEALEQEKRKWRDEHVKAPESKLDPPVLKDLKCFISDSDSLVEQRMIAHVLAELGELGDRMRAEAKARALADTPGRDSFWKRLYVRACELRRAKRLDPLLARWQRFVFNQHRHVPGSWKYTEVLSDAHRNRQYRPGASLNILGMNGIYGRAYTLLEDAGGILRNPDVSYDGKRVLFAWKKSDREDDFHLYEMEVATGERRQLTDGLGFADYEGVYLPDGNIVFSSTRCAADSTRCIRSSRRSRTMAASSTRVGSTATADRSTRSHCSKCIPTARINANSTATIPGFRQTSSTLGRFRDHARCWPS